MGKRRKRSGLSLGSNLLPILDYGGQKKTKLGKRRHSIISLGKMVAIIAFIMVIVAKSIVKIVNKLHPSSQTTQPSSIDSRFLSETATYSLDQLGRVKGTERVLFKVC